MSKRASHCDEIGNKPSFDVLIALSTGIVCPFCFNAILDFRNEGSAYLARLFAIRLLVIDYFDVGTERLWIR